MKQSNSEKIRQSDRKFTEGMTAMVVGLTFVILGATVLNLPRWTVAIFIPAGILAYILGLRWYRQSYKQSKRSKAELLDEGNR